MTTTARGFAVLPLTARQKDLPIVPLISKRFPEFLSPGWLVPALMLLAGCQGLTGSMQLAAFAPNERKAQSQATAPSSSTSGAPADSSSSALSAADRAILARATDKDAKGRTRSVWIRSVDRSAEFHWHYPKLDEILARPPTRQPNFHTLLTDSDPIVSANAAIVLARAGQGAGREQLVAAVAAPDIPLPQRCAAVEALANLNDPKAVQSLKELLAQYGRQQKDAKTPYIPELHAELIHGLARRDEPGRNPLFIEALKSPSPDVRLEALKAFAASRETQLPREAVDLCTSGDWRLRAAALEAMASHGHPQASGYISSALSDGDVRVRNAAIAALGILGTPEAVAMLEKMLKDPNEAVRAQAVAALGAAKHERLVIEAAGDKSWRVRRKVAEALASFPDREAAAALERLLDDNSAEVRLAAVAAVKAWPVERSGPLLLAAMSNSVFVARKAAAEQLAAVWPPAAEFPVEGPPDRRAEVLKQLNKAFRSQMSSASADAMLVAASPPQTTKKASPAQVAEVERLISEKNFKALADFGPTLSDALEQLQYDRKQPLPDEVYRDVLAKHDRVFAVLDQLTSTETVQRRRAAERLADLAGKTPPGRLAVGRLAQIMSVEQDALVWQSVLQAVADDPSRQAAELACMGVGHASAEVRRRACEHLAAHADPAHVQVLIPALDDQDQAVVCQAIRALAAAKTPDAKPIQRLLACGNEDIQLEAAAALARLGDPAAKPALERLAYSRDPAVRTKTARAMGECPDPEFTGALIRLLNDNQTVARAALVSLPKVVGKDMSQSPDQTPATSTEKILRWKNWYQREAGRSTKEAVRRTEYEVR
jgi:HEAT repeat protein